MCPAIPFSFFVLLGPFLRHPGLTAYLPLSCGRTPTATGQAFWRTAPYLVLRSIISGSLLSQLLVRPLARCPLPALLSFSNSCLRGLLPVGCRFLTGFRLESCRGVGVGCGARHLRSISPIFPDGFCTLLIFYASAYYTVLQGGLVTWYPRFPSITEEALFFLG